MSVSFTICNPRKLFRRKPVLSVQECLDLASESITQFTQTAFDTDAEFHDFLAQPLSQMPCLLLGQEDKSGRGFECSFDEHAQNYIVRVNTPATIYDWQMALNYLKDLAIFLNQPIVSEQGDTFMPQNIHTFPFEQDIESGIASGADMLNQEQYAGMELTLFGINRPVALNKEIYERFQSSENPVVAFSDFVSNIQWLDAYSAHPRFYQDSENEEISGVCTLMYDTPTILRYQPKMDYFHQLSDNDIARWIILLVGQNSEYEVAYTDVIERLPKNKYRWIDAAYILVDKLSDDEIKQLAE